MACRGGRDAVWWASAGVFGLNGIFVGSAVARVPALRDQVAAPASFLGLALLALGVGSVLVMPLSSGLTTRFGSARVTRLGMLAASAGWLGAGLSSTVAALGCCCLVAGAGVGLWDVAMNIQGHVVERRDQRSWMPRFHAAVSAGMIIGAGWASLAARAGLSPAIQFLITFLVAGGGTVAATRRYLPDKRPQANRTPERPGAAPRDRTLWRLAPVLLIGLLVGAGAMAEGAAGDWLALMLVDTRSASQSLAALAYGGFAAAMLAGRLTGGSAIDRWGRVAVLKVCGVIAMTGILLLCLVPITAVGFAGAALWGLGVSVMFPAGMSAAGEAVAGRGSEGIAVVSTIGYGGFLAGPPVLGMLADVVRIDRALLLAALCVAVVAAFAHVERENRSEPVAAGQPTAS